MNPKTTFKIKIGAPTNSEQVYLEGEGIECGDILVAHALPVYRQKDYPIYKTRKNGPYCVSMKASGLRVSGTNQKLVFQKMEDAAEFGDSVAALVCVAWLPHVRGRPAQGAGVCEGASRGVVRADDQSGYAIQGRAGHTGDRS